MKKVSKTTKYKFNITRAVGVTFTYRFSIGDIESITKKALENNGVNNPDEIIKRHNFTYAGMFKCGQCGCTITMEKKTKYIKSINKVREYTYYHCSHKKGNCKQASVYQEDITNETIKKLNDIEMHPILLEWALDYLDGQKGKESKETKQVDNNIKDKIKELETELSSLTRMRAKELINDNEYSRERKSLMHEIEALKQTDDNKPSEQEINKLTKENFILATHAKQKFINGTFRDKKDILAFIGSNRTIYDKNILITLQKWLLPLAENTPQYNAKIARLEPLNFGLDKRKSESLNSLRPMWLAYRDSFRTFITQSNYNSICESDRLC